MAKPIQSPSAPLGLTLGMVCALAIAAAAPVMADDVPYAGLRSKMVETIVAEARLTRDLIGKPALDPRVLRIMGLIPRHQFVPPPLARFAYLNMPLPVGHGQTVSQPYLVALMTDLARIGPGDKVLLIGIGGGYHAAILSRLAGGLSCVEMQRPVAEAAMDRLKRLGFDNIELRIADPYYGWRGGRERFDAIIVRQAMDFIPRPLIAQLKPGGRLVLPAGRSDVSQDLTVATKRGRGRVVERRVMPVRFTRMPGGSRI